MQRRAVLAGLALGALGACGNTAFYDPLPEVTRRAYSDGGDTSLTLYTVIARRNRGGAHTGLLIDGSQRVIWDPAGTFRHPHVPERGDLLYGITPLIQRVYIDYHARETYDMVEQTVAVPPETAEQAIRLAAANGPASNATCARETSAILRQLPGFGSIRRTWYPKALMEDFGRLPGVTERIITDDDADDNHNVIFEYVPGTGG
ncbi:lipoprotein, putative [Oceaniovalibus guishaninsula JLT2003]|uniref:Lipoprotein, putative n=1 Tax=Oceaniovalibus guishaninsula JLT2003 TaxID=1231392 RepID=K2H7Y7_9RHOB|nr:hypothetical protein [Oceaniovalibus guishaninsula]EKE43738.1 lipoprotein, putative [Oceaniovalibus guishaninsula JLT2003]